MKKITLGLAAIVLTFSAMAQNGNADRKANKESKKERFENKGEQKGRGHVKHGESFEKLNLTESQQSQMKVINENFKKEMQELKSSNLNDEQLKERRQAILKSRHDNIQAILTDEQKTQFKAIKSERGDKKNHDYGNKGKIKNAGEKFEKMSKELNLTAEQTAKINLLKTSVQSKIKDIRSNTSLTEEQKKEEIRSVVKNQKSAFEEILTAEQKQQLKEKRKNHRGGNGVK